MGGVASGLINVLVAIVGVAALAVIFSRKANTSGVIQSAGQAFASSLTAAQGAITGGGGTTDFSKVGVSINGF